jgi:uncharacterized protein (DUF2141 family)
MPGNSDDTQQRTEGPTPHGGAYAIAFFRDKDGNPCPKADAAGMEVVEFDADDNQVFRTYMQRPDDPDVPI